MKYIFLILALGGGVYYFYHHWTLEDSLAFIQKHKTASWAPRAQYTAAFICHQREDYHKSQALFSQLLEDYPASPFVPQSLIYLDEAAQANGDWEAAKTALNRYIENYPDRPDIEWARRRLELLKYRHGA